MKIKSLKLDGFRNLQKISLEFADDRSIFAFTGANGQGKTNLLEAIFLLAISKSFRTRENLDLVGFEKDHCSLKADIQRGDENLNLELIVTRCPGKKVLKINGVQKKAADYIGNLNVVFFSPDDIGMIHLSPTVRRRYLDLLLSQLDRDYLEDSLKFQLVLKQRNSLLRQIVDHLAKEDDLEFWDQQLAELGTSIIRKRLAVVQELNDRVAEFYAQVSERQDQLKTQYHLSAPGTEDQDAFLKALLKGRSRDIALGSTQLGPHRDDLAFLCNGRDMASFASRGEWRSLVLSLKFAEIDLLKDKTGFYPVLLLDDVFSELDEERQKHLFNVLRSTQTFITTTHQDFLNVIQGPKEVYELLDGKVDRSGGSRVSISPPKIARKIV